jgi:ribonucleoside-diphosphate reductase alpha chain
VVPENAARWDALRQRIQRHGLRNSLLIAIAPTATIASICRLLRVRRAAGVQPVQARNTVRRLPAGQPSSGAAELKQLGLWTPEIRDAIKLADGSIQGIDAIPANLRQIYRTAWELPMRALIDMAA